MAKAGIDCPLILKASEKVSPSRFKVLERKYERSTAGANSGQTVGNGWAAGGQRVGKGGMFVYNKYP